MKLLDIKRALRSGPYAFPGGYPLYFITEDGGVLSFAAVRENWREIVSAKLRQDKSGGWFVVAAAINYEDASLFCDHTNKRIESAYAEPESEPAAPSLDSLDTFTRAYIACALWSSTDESDESGGVPFDENYDASDIAPETLAAIIEDCKQFQESNAALLAQAYAAPEWQAEQQRHDKPQYDESRAGHDFWLTRNGHGAGFWDRGLGPVGDALSDASHVWGSVDLYLGDDSKIYAS